MSCKKTYIKTVWPFFLVQTFYIKILHLRLDLVACINSFIYIVCKKKKEVLFYTVVGNDVLKQTHFILKSSAASLALSIGEVMLALLIVAVMI